MTTVVITPKYIASDHCVIHQSYPTQTKVDLSHKKIFTDPTNAIIVATGGEYLPEQIDHPDTWATIYDIFSYIMASLADCGFDNGIHLPKDRLPMQQYAKVFDMDARSFLITRKYRFILKYSPAFKEFTATRLGDHAGLGSGGAYATGMLMAGMRINDIWEPLHKLDPQSSREHTIIPLSSLKALTKMDKMIRNVRSTAHRVDGNEGAAS